MVKTCVRYNGDSTITWSCTRYYMVTIVIGVNTRYIYHHFLVTGSITSKFMHFILYLHAYRLKRHALVLKLHGYYVFLEKLILYISSICAT